MRRRTGSQRVGTVRVATFMALPEVLRDLGMNPGKVLGEVNLDPDFFEHGDNRISHAMRRRLFEHCVARTGCPHFGLLVGQRGGLACFGLIGSLVRHAPNVGAALRGLVSYVQATVSGAELSLAVADGRVVFAYTVDQASVASEQIDDGALALMVKVMRELCGARWKPVEVLFAHREPADVAPFRRFFRTRLQFNSVRNALVFSSDELRERLAGAETELGRLLQTQIEAIRGADGDRFAEQVRGVLRAALLTDHASVGRVAELMSMHPRTLHRRLSDDGTNFRSLVEEVRFEIAKRLLQNTTLPVGEIAESLGYSRASAFTLAFRRWSGTTPTGWRAPHGRGQPP